jgi:hypothetical protein
MDNPMAYTLGRKFDLFRLIIEQLKVRIPATEERIEELKAELKAEEVKLTQLLALQQVTPQETD